MRAHGSGPRRRCRVADCPVEHLSRMDADRAGTGEEIQEIDVDELGTFRREDACDGAFGFRATRGLARTNPQYDPPPTGPHHLRRRNKTILAIGRIENNVDAAAL